MILPELATSGYYLHGVAEARACAQPPYGQALDDWHEEARRADAVVIGGFCERGATDEELYNSAAIVDGTGVLAVHRKVHLWSGEQDLFAAGEAPPVVVSTRLGRIGLCICMDIAFPEIGRALALAGADLIAVPVNCPDASWPAGDLPSDVLYYRATAQANRVFVAVSDRCGSERGNAFLGWSTIVDEHGMPLAGPPPDRGPGIVMADCELARARDKSWGARNDLFDDRRPELYEARRVDPTESP